MRIDSIQQLRDKRIKVTPQRVAILNIMKNGGHFTGEQIYNELKKKMPSISLSTVYSTLDTLERNEILSSFEVSGMRWFESRTESHVNVFCVDKNRVIDIDMDVSWLLNELKKKGISPTKVSIVAHSTCDQRNI